MAMGPCDIQNTYIDLTCNKQNGHREETEKWREREGQREGGSKTQRHCKNLLTKLYTQSGNSSSLGGGGVVS